MKTVYIVVGGVAVAVAAGAAGYYLGKRNERKRIEDRITEGLDRVVSDVLGDIGLSGEQRTQMTRELVEGTSALATGASAKNDTTDTSASAPEQSAKVIPLHPAAKASEDTMVEFTDHDRRTIAGVIGVDFNVLTRANLLTDTDLVIKLVKGAVAMTIRAMAQDAQQATVYEQRMEEVYAANESGLLVAGELMNDAAINGRSFVDVLELYMVSLLKMIDEDAGNDADQLRAFVGATREALPFNVFGRMGEG